jgi:acetyl-CoA synthetase
VRDAAGEVVGKGTGVLVIDRPWPGMLSTLHDDDERYVETYWSRFGERTYVAGDAASRDAEGHIRILGRIDDVINVSGHRLSTAEVEAAITAHGDVAEAAVVAGSDELTGQAIVAFVILRGGLEGTPELAAAISAQIAERIGKLARPREIVWVDELPKTRSGKIMRRLLADLADGRATGDVTTLGDPATLTTLRERLAAQRSAEP